MKDSEAVKLEFHFELEFGLCIACQSSVKKSLCDPTEGPALAACVI